MGGRHDFPHSIVTTDENELEGGWHHVVVTSTSLNSSVKIYVDGQLVNSSLNGNDSTFDQEETLYIGSRSDLVGIQHFSFDGKLDEVKLYGRELTVADVLELYNSYPSIKNGEIFVENASFSVPDSLFYNDYNVDVMKFSLKRLNHHKILR